MRLISLMFVGQTTQNGAYLQARPKVCHRVAQSYLYPCLRMNSR
jgi:hypothetical protein